MLSHRTIFAGLAAGAALAATRPVLAATPPKLRNVVLVHGAYADGSSWSEVSPLLQQAGRNVTAVQNPLMSLVDDCNYTRRALALQDGPTVLVAHSYGGEVITETRVDPKVSALVYCGPVGRMRTRTTPRSPRRIRRRRQAPGLSIRTTFCA